MPYTYHGESGLIPLAGETQRTVQGNMIVIEKDFAIRQDRVESGVRALMPGNYIPGTKYLIDTPPQVQFGNDGFARIRASALFGDFAEAETLQNIQQISVTLDSDFSGNSDLIAAANVLARFNLVYATFSVIRPATKGSQIPALPDIVQPTDASATIRNATGALIAGDTSDVANITFGEVAWQIYQQNTNNIYDNRAIQYDITAICAPRFVRVAKDYLFVEFVLDKAGFGDTMASLRPSPFIYKYGRAYGSLLNVASYIQNYGPLPQGISLDLPTQISDNLKLSGQQSRAINNYLLQVGDPFRSVSV